MREGGNAAAAAGAEVEAHDGSEQGRRWGQEPKQETILVTIRGSDDDGQGGTGHSVGTGMMVIKKAKGNGKDGNGVSENYFSSLVPPRTILHRNSKKQLESV